MTRNAALACDIAVTLDAYGRYVRNERYERNSSSSYLLLLDHRETADRHTPRRRTSTKEHP